MEETGEPIRQGRIAYGVSGLLIVALLLSTVVMLNNYGELKNIKSTLAGISREREAQAVNKILSAYTETTKQSATTVAGLESKKARATNGSNVTQKKMTTERLFQNRQRELIRIITAVTIVLPILQMIVIILTVISLQVVKRKIIKQKVFPVLIQDNTIQLNRDRHCMILV